MNEPDNPVLFSQETGVPLDVFLLFIELMLRNCHEDDEFFRSQWNTWKDTYLYRKQGVYLFMFLRNDFPFSLKEKASLWSDSSRFLCLWSRLFHLLPEEKEFLSQPFSRAYGLGKAIYLRKFFSISEEEYKESKLKFVETELFKIQKTLQDIDQKMSSTGEFCSWTLAQKKEIQDAQVNLVTVQALLQSPPDFQEYTDPVPVNTNMDNKLILIASAEINMETKHEQNEDFKQARSNFQQFQANIFPDHESPVQVRVMVKTEDLEDEQEIERKEEWKKLLKEQVLHLQ